MWVDSGLLLWLDSGLLLRVNRLLLRINRLLLRVNRLLLRVGWRHVAHLVLALGLLDYLYGRAGALTAGAAEPVQCDRVCDERYHIQHPFPTTTTTISTRY